MRYVAIHFDGYGGCGNAYPAFEIEADSPTSPVKGVFRSDGLERGPYLDDGQDPGELGDYELVAAKEEIGYNAEVTAGNLAWMSGGQHVGGLAQKGSGLMVYTSKEGLLAEDDQFLWEDLSDEDLPGPEDDPNLPPRPASEVEKDYQVL